MVPQNKEKRPTKNDPTEGNRYAALNCYDFDRLRQEASDLRYVLGRDFTSALPTLSKILDESNGEGRQLPLNMVKGKGAKFFHLLHIVDEILYTENRFIQNPEMRRLIRTRAEEYGVPINGEISESALKRAYGALDDMIGVETHRGDRATNATVVYEKGAYGHKYKPYDDERPLRAFAVDVTINELRNLETEIIKTIIFHLDSDPIRFSEDYPLLGAVASWDKVPSILVKGTTSLALANYLPPEHLDLKQKVMRAIRDKQCMVVGTERVVPVRVNTCRGAWALVGMDPDTRRHKLIRPEDLEPGFETAPMETDEEMAGCIMGLSPLHDTTPYDVTLQLTLDGYDKVMAKTSPLAPLRPQAVGKGNTVRLTVCLNDDFFEAIYRLDKTRKLRQMAPAEVWQKYVAYYEQTQGIAYVPYQNRRGYLRDRR